MADLDRGPAASDQFDHGERHGSWLELFFDLVFVAAVAALATQLHEEHSAEGLVVFAGLFVPVWWAWRSFTWYATGFDTDDGPYRLALLGAMLGVAVLSAGIDGAANGDSDSFVIAYAVLLAILVGLYGRAAHRFPDARALAVRYIIGNAIGAGLWLVSLALGEDVRPILWAAAMVVLIATPAWLLRLPRRAAYDAGHLAERYGLFTLIVLGESVVVTAAGLETGSKADAAIIAGLGFVIASAIWWVYFERFQAMPAGGRTSRFVWAQVHLLIFFGIAAAAVGIEFAVEAAAHGRRMSLADSLPLSVGLGAYLAAMAAIRWATRRWDWVVAVRFATAAIVLLLAAAAGPLGPLIFTVVISVLVVGEAVIELRKAPPSVPRPQPVLPFPMQREAPAR